MKEKTITRNSITGKERIKVRIVKFHGNEYWLRPYQIRMLEKDMTYMQKCNGVKV